MTDDQEQQVRRLLAEARHDEPIPAEVAARLDRVLADLGQEPGRSATVVGLADRRRRAGRLLLAAAAVVVAGVGVSQVVDGVGVGGASESATSESSGSDAGLSADEAPSEEAPGAGEGGRSAAEDFESTRTRPFQLRAQRFSRDAAALQSLGDAAFVAEDRGEGRPELLAGSRLDRAGEQDVCEPGDWGRGGFYPVVYEDDPGWMVLRPRQGDTQVADLFLCGSEQAVRSVTLPVR